MYSNSITRRLSACFGIVSLTAGSFLACCLALLGLATVATNAQEKPEEYDKGAPTKTNNAKPASKTLPAESNSKHPVLKQPVALALVDNGDTLLVAHRVAGTIAIVDVATKKVVFEQRLGRSLSDLAVRPGTNEVLATDSKDNQLVVLAYANRTLKEARRIPVPMAPTTVKASADGKQAYVASLWARQLAFVSLDVAGQKPVIVDLPFAPGRTLELNAGKKLLVADHFGGNLGLVDGPTRKVLSVRETNMHNIRGLATDQSGDHVWISHQILHPTGRANLGEIQSGSLMFNGMRKIPVSDLANPRTTLNRYDPAFSLGDVERGAGDPGEIVPVGASLAVLVSGGNELHLGKPEEVLWSRVPTGDRPTALAVDAKRSFAYVANTLADSITVVSLAEPTKSTTIALGPAKNLTAEERGERLFFDARLSFESWMSCQSCHTSGHSNGRLNDNFSDKSFGTPKRVLSLLGVRDTAPLAWLGHVKSIEDQVHASAKSTMNGAGVTDAQAQDMAAYIRTLSVPPSLAKARGQVDSDAVARGKRIFKARECTTCHVPPLYTSPRIFDVGLRDEAGEKMFNPPSLRGVSQTGPYFHDGRAATLEDVLVRIRHQLKEPLNDADLRDLLAFLNSL